MEVGVEGLESEFKNFVSLLYLKIQNVQIQILFTEKGCSAARLYFLKVGMFLHMWRNLYRKSKS